MSEVSEHIMDVAEETAGVPVVEFTAAQKQAAEDLVFVLPQLRRETSRFLDKMPVVGELLEADDSQGRHAPCWLHRASTADGPKPVVFEIHGGGFAVGDAREQDGLCEWVRDSFDVHCVCVEYRMAPENPYPAALEDVLATVGYFLENAEAYGMDRTKFYLMGCSAGANLSMAAAMKLAARGSSPLAGCIMHYPFFDATKKALAGATELSDDSDGLSLPERMMEAFDVWYVGQANAANPFISPVYASDAMLRNLPFISFWPAVGDSLLPDAEVMHQHLVDAGADCSYHPVEGAYHGYVEDAANTQLYYATTMPETIQARPANFKQTAEDTVRASLEEVLGPAKRVLPFKE